MTNDKIRYWVEEEMGIEEELVLFEDPNYADAFIGIDMVAEYPRAIYDFHKMISHLENECGMDHDEAREFYYYNTERSLAYIDIQKSPIIMEGFFNYFEEEDLS